MNEQPIEKQQHHPDGVLHVHSIFHTIQGEGPFAGQRAVFIRLAGCNLQCPGCDTIYADKRQPIHPDALLTAVEQYGLSNLVVITGGEPFRQNIEPLVLRLLHTGHKVQIETNGTLYNHLPWGHSNLTVVCSPKTGKLNPQLQFHINAYKYVIKAGSVSEEDGLPIQVLDHPVREAVARPLAGRSVYVQPMDEKDEGLNYNNLQAAAQSAMNFGYTLGVQLHKLIGAE